MLQIKYEVGKLSLSTGILGGKPVYLTDGALAGWGRRECAGGIVDTTGIVAHLQQKASRIVAFYNNNDDLTVLNSSFGYLFGVLGETDSQNSIEGWELAQVFDSSLFAPVISNMTNGAILRARLSTVQVREQYRGEAQCDHR